MGSNIILPLPLVIFGMALSYFGLTLFHTQKEAS